MILLAEIAVTINSSIAPFFTYVTNMENYDEWFPGVVSISSLNQLPYGVKGKKYQEQIAMPAGNVNLVIEVKECRVNQKFYTEGDLEPLFPAMLMEFQEESANATQFVLKYFSRNQELNDTSDMIKGLKLNLGERILIAGDNLQRHFNLQQPKG